MEQCVCEFHDMTIQELAWVAGAQPLSHVVLH